MATFLATAGGLVVLCGVALGAYHRGRREGRVTLPPELVAELRQHKTRCIGESPDRVALEIGLLCETEAGEHR
jgi:hypothetical protein